MTKAKVANSCDCLKNLDELRIAHEKGEIESFVVVVIDKRGAYVMGHNPDPMASIFTIAKISLDEEEQ